jgi:hypothetical protein
MLRVEIVCPIAVFADKSSLAQLSCALWLLFLSFSFDRKLAFHYVGRFGFYQVQSGFLRE